MSADDTQASSIPSGEGLADQLVLKCLYITVCHGRTSSVLVKVRTSTAEQFAQINLGWS